MSPKYRLILSVLVCNLVLLLNPGCAYYEIAWPILPEQRSISFRDMEKLPKAAIPPDLPSPPTVLDPQPEAKERFISLDEAIRITLENTKVVRVLAGVQAVSSGRTIYDPAISNTIIDQERGRFDPRLNITNTVNRNEPPSAIIDPLEPFRARITGIRTDNYEFNANLAKTTLTGGEVSVDFLDNLSRFNPGDFPLNPQNRYATSLRWQQPLLKGAGIEANLAPIVIARINTERSFFQLKDSLQDSVRGVVEAYWALVFARTDEWARQQQVEQGKFAYEYAKARFEAKIRDVNSATVAQARSAYANFKANLISAQANVLQREAALRNIMGLPPSDGQRLIPTTPPTSNKLVPNWDEIVRLAEQNRPDLIELKLILEADQQRLIQANNQALPQVDVNTLYRWNGLEGETPTGDRISTDGGQFTDWSVGVNFSVPLGLRRDRALLRQQQLVVARDWANLDQGLHQSLHALAISNRNLAQFYEQYNAFKDARAAALINLQQQAAEARTGRLIFLNVLQAITDWGNSVSAEAQALSQYNTELATLEAETGTILEAHGVRLFEERFGAISPLGRLAKPRMYPATNPPGPNANRYPDSSKAAENFFNLEAPYERRKANEPELLPPPTPGEDKGDLPPLPDPNPRNPLPRLTPPGPLPDSGPLQLPQINLAPPNNRTNTMRAQLSLSTKN